MLSCSNLMMLAVIPSRKFHNTVIGFYRPFIPPSIIVIIITIFCFIYLYLYIHIYICKPQI